MKENVFEKNLMENLPISPPPSSFPSDVLKWMKRNAAPKISLKLMQLCKYFQFQEFPYFVVKGLLGDNNGWKYQPLSEETGLTIVYKSIDFKNITKLIWVTERLQIFCKNCSISILLPKIAVCDITDLSLQNQNNISFEEFKIITAAKMVMVLKFDDTVIKFADGKAVPLEEIFEFLPKLTVVNIRRNCNSIVSANQATKNISSHFHWFNLEDFDETFKIEECFKFIQDNQQIRFSIRNNHEISNHFTQKLQSLTDYLIKSWSAEHHSPSILFWGQTDESKDKLAKLEDQHHRLKAKHFLK